METHTSLSLLLTSALLALTSCQSIDRHTAYANGPERTSQWNVLDFGAVPDAETDNTAAFQQALDAAFTAKGGAVFVPTGRYAFDGSLRFPKDVPVVPWSPARHGVAKRCRDRDTTRDPQGLQERTKEGTLETGPEEEETSGRGSGGGRRPRHNRAQFMACS